MRRGIDVSTHQKAVDWAKVKAAGISFAIIKATQGKSETTPSLYLFTDSRFKANICNASNKGIECGVYHYLTATTVAGAKEEAAYFLKTIKPYKAYIKLYAVVDVESKYLTTDKAILTQIVNAFCAAVKQGGYDPMVYTNPNFLSYRLNSISSWKLWLALWRSKTNVPTVKQYPSLTLWQWGSEAVDGITGKVDANFMIVENPEEVPEPPKSETVVKPNHNGDVNKMDNTASEWAAESVKWCADNGILLGDQNGDLMLHQPLTREQACLVAQRLYQKTVEDAAAEVAKRMLAALKLKID